MPIYEFLCESCGRLNEVMQRVSDPAPAACTACGQGPLTRQVSRTSFQLKGGGWYADLYASKKEAPAAGAAPAASGAEPGAAKPAATPGAVAAPSAAAPAAPSTPAAAPASAPAAPASGGTSSKGA